MQLGKDELETYWAWLEKLVVFRLAEKVLLPVREARCVRQEILTWMGNTSIIYVGKVEMRGRNVK